MQDAYPFGLGWPRWLVFVALLGLGHPFLLVASGFAPFRLIDDASWPYSNAVAIRFLPFFEPVAQVTLIASVAAATNLWHRFRYVLSTAIWILIFPFVVYLKPVLAYGFIPGYEFGIAFIHEQPQVGFDWQRLAEVRPGMPRSELEQLLGPPVLVTPSHLIYSHNDKNWQVRIASDELGNVLGVHIAYFYD